jgi:hypothetical protein
MQDFVIRKLLRVVELSRFVSDYASSNHPTATCSFTAHHGAARYTAAAKNQQDDSNVANPNPPSFDHAVVRGGVAEGLRTRVMVTA